MSYTALYRKYRPGEFEDVKGQDHIVTTLKNQIKADRIGHAYLFCGTRGTGKTTVAKIFAKAVNCEHPVDGSPCGECPTCRAIAAGTAMNVIEIDAASNNSVDDVRQIREEVSYSPTEGRYKVYIIDEVHMLSTNAFNALLKTLEEPPSYVIFILATTEAHKIPITILSRCQKYDFRRITIDTIADRLMDLMQQENVDVEEKAIRYIAKAGDGSMRDALSLLDQCISFYLGETLTYDHVLEVLGAADTEVFSKLVRSVMAGDSAGALTILEQMVIQGRELGQFVTDFIWYLRNLLLIKGSDDIGDILDMSAENLAILKEEAAALESEVIMRYIRIFSDVSAQIKYAQQKRILIEIALIKLCRPEMEVSQDALLDRIVHLEKQMEQGIPVATAAAQTVIPAAAQQENRKKPKLPKAIPEDIQTIVRNWESIIHDLPPINRNFLHQAHLSLAGEGKLMIVLDDDVSFEYMNREEHASELKQLLANRLGKDVDMLIRKNEHQGPFEDNYIDLSKVVNMEVVVEDDEEE